VRILIVKLSSLGDVVHAMPAVQDLRRAVPTAQIDWVVERGFAPLVRRCDGVGRVIECELRRWRKTLMKPRDWAATAAAWRAFKTELQAQEYELVIDLQGLSKSALVASMARLSPSGARIAMANRTDGSSYEAPTRWVADLALPVTAHSHAVQRSRELCGKAVCPKFNAAQQTVAAYGLLSAITASKFAIEKNTVLAQSEAIDAPVVGPFTDQFKQRFETPAAPPVVLVHGTSRADKLWDEGNWLALGQRLWAAGHSLALPHGNDDELARSLRLHRALADAGVPASGVTVWPRLGLGELTDALAASAGVIGVDSGLSHIAVALDLSHVQIYNFDTAWRTGPPPGSARQRSVFATPQPTLDAVWQAWGACTA
jgi:heptosyltransferase I